MEPNNEINMLTDTESSSEVSANLEICPNCLEPNPDNLAVCRYCGMPLHPGAEADPSAMPESEQTLEAARTEAVPEAKKPAKKQENGFRRMMPWLGLYLIYYAVTGCFDINRQIKAAAESGEPLNAKLAYLSQVIWLIAGLLMAWPLLKKWYRKLRHLPEEDETPAPAEPEAENDAELTEATEEDAEEETSESDPDADDGGSAAEEISSEADADWQDENEGVTDTADTAVEPESLLNDSTQSKDDESDESGFEEEDSEAAKWL